MKPASRSALGLLRDVDRVVEANESVEREDRAGQEGCQHASPLFELEGPPRVAVTPGEGSRPDHHYQDEAGDLDARQYDVDPHRLRDAVEVYEPDQDHKDERGAYDGYGYELRQVVTGEGQCKGAGRGDP
jgi:hypothetical protein